MTFTTELLTPTFEKNIIIKIGAVYYSEKQPDSGLTVDADKVGIIINAKIGGSTVDIRDVKNTISSVTFDLLDKGEVITGQISAAADNLLDQEVIVYAGFITGSFAFASYKEMSRANIRTITKKENSYSFSAKDKTSLLDVEFYKVFDTLNGSIDAVVTTIVLNDASAFPSAGTAKVGDEFFTWSGNTGTDLTGVTRNTESSVAATHEDGDDVYLVQTITDNVIDLMLQFMISPGGGGAFDVLTYGLGIPAATFDTATFTAIRDANYSAQDFKFLILNEDNFLNFIEKELLLPTFTRFFIKDGLIALGILDQVDFTTIGSLDDISEEDTDGSRPGWTINSDKIVNEIIYKWNYTEGTDTFARTSIFTDADSIATFGARDPLTFEFTGVKTALGGAAFITSQATKMLARLSTPTAEITIGTKFNKVEINVADKINLNHRYLPAQGGALGIADTLEIMSKTINLRDGKAKFKLQYPSFSGVRIALIGPAPLIASVTSQKIFTVPDGSCFKAGDFLQLYGLADAVNEILSVVGNTITMVDSFATTLTTSIRIIIPEYGSNSANQKGQFGSVGLTGANFADGSKPYEILA